MIKLSITEFTTTPGPAHISQGSYSGEAFRKLFLAPNLLLAINDETKLIVDLDGAWGFSVGFLRGAFGELRIKFSKQTVLDTLSVSCTDDPSIIGKIYDLIEAEDA